ncbi:hypothetical protein GCM10010244_01830 [Streptomyces coeruleorubidus]|nr:hypothetical protein GCM10010244_01830 [Streptomyces bellus]
MTTVVMHNVVSVDGFIADTDDQVGPVFDWYGNGDVQLNEYAKAKELTGEDRDVGVAAGDVGGQAFALGLVDEVAMDVVPVVFGSGKRYVRKQP